MDGDDIQRLDVVLVGGGLQSSLIALALAARQPERSVAVVEREPRVGGEHLWSFHAADVPPGAASWVDPLVVRRWPTHDVRFEGLSRTLEMPYGSVSSRRLVEVMDAWSERPGAHLLRGVAVTRVEGEAVHLADGRVLRADLVVDARGPGALAMGARFAYQKFVGLELELEQPSSCATPILMDARVPQTDGFRFVYVLPFEARRVLVEDTYYSESPDLDDVRIESEILAYAARAGFVGARVVRTERGVLPLPRSAPIIAKPSVHGPLVAGYAGGFFHPMTGYSFPAAARLAECVASSAPSELLGSPGLAALVAKLGRQARFATLLNRMLHDAFAPEHRAHVLERFYRLPEDTIARFYALETTASDRARIVCGRPPRGFDLARAIGLRGNA